LVCQDAANDDECPAAYFVTSYGDLYCFRCGLREQYAIDRAEEEEAAEWEWMDTDPFDYVDDDYWQGEE
jgi:hypothetical protein